MQFHNDTFVILIYPDMATRFSYVRRASNKCTKKKTLKKSSIFFLNLIWTDFQRNKFDTAQVSNQLMDIG